MENKLKEFLMHENSHIRANTILLIGALSLVNDPESVVGKRLRVRWAKGKYYTGVVDSYDESIGKHRIKYDDGDVRDYILERKTVEWI